MKYLSYLLVVLLLAACGTTTVITEPQAPKQIIPLAVGNVWEFKDETGRSDYIAEVRAIETIDGKEWYVYRELNDDSIFYVNNSDKGQIELGYEDYGEYLVLPYPVEHEMIYDQFGVMTKVTPDEQLTVPAGTFNTYKYIFNLNHPSYAATYWIAPGVGVIKVIYDSSTFELVNYTLQ